MLNNIYSYIIYFNIIYIFLSIIIYLIILYNRKKHSKSEKYLSQEEKFKYIISCLIINLTINIGFIFTLKLNIKKKFNSILKSWEP